MNLFDPLIIRSLKLKNRIVLSPMQQYSAVDGIPKHWHLVHLGSRAVGGAGLIITECVAVSPNGRNTLYDLGMWNDSQKEPWKPIIEFIHEQGAKIAIQLWHAGGKSSRKHPNERMEPLNIGEGGWSVKSASATEIMGVVPEELTLQEINQLKKDFIEAAKRAVEAGFDAIELHAAHGYLLHQFYSSLINTRKDKYGGRFENRIRLLVEIVDEIRAVIPNTLPLMVRLSAVDYVETDQAWHIEDSIRLTRILKRLGVDLITASGGGFTNVDASKVFPNYQLPLASKIKEKSDIAVGTVGMITTAKQANSIIENKQADLVIIAREHLRDPYFALHAASELGIKANIPWQYKRAF